MHVIGYIGIRVNVFPRRSCANGLFLEGRQV
jgi:hypothetical protein